MAGFMEFFVVSSLSGLAFSLLWQFDIPGSYISVQTKVKLLVHSAPVYKYLTLLPVRESKTRNINLISIHFNCRAQNKISYLAPSTSL